MELPQVVHNLSIILFLRSKLKKKVNIKFNILLKIIQVKTVKFLKKNSIYKKLI